MSERSDRLSFATKFFYGAGDIFGGGALMLIGFFYLFFMTEVAGLKPGLAGLVLLIGKAWDAISDPLMGWISDRTRSRFGRRRVYFLAGIVPILVSFALLWLVPPFSSQAGIFLFFLCANILFNSVITMVMIPYNALIPELTGDYKERGSLTGFRMVFSNIASLAAAALPMLIVDVYADPTTGYLAMGLTFGAIFALPFIGVFLVSFERGGQPEKTRFNLWGDMIQALANRTFRHLIGVYLPTFLAVDVISAVMVYYLTYVLGRGGSMDLSIVLGLLLFSQTVFLPAYVKVAARWSKQASYLVGALIWIVLMPVLFFLGLETPFAVVLILAVLIGAGTAGAGFSPWAMFPDVLDVDELATGKRRQGIYSGVMTFLRKVSSALALAVVGWMIDLSGYAQDLPETASQPASFIYMVRFLVAFFPVLLLLVGIYFSRRYGLTPERQAEIRSILEARKEEEPVDLSGKAGELAGLLFGPQSAISRVHGGDYKA